VASRLGRRDLTTEAALEIFQRKSFSYFVHEANPANELVSGKTAADWTASIPAC
jgi:hypothetical protein